jgi:uncharacterized protein YllA (UPF0747 family)
LAPTLRHISFRRLGTSDVHQRYLEDDRDIVGILGKRPRNVAELLRRAPTGAGRVVPPRALSAALLAYAERHGAPEPVLANARAMAEGNTHVVVTGQQPGLLGGPLFTLHKAATAIRLCREIRALPDAPAVVPLFWNHSDDHDLDEANRAFLVNGSQEVQRFRLDIDRTSEPLRHIAVGREVENLLREVDDLLPQSEFREWAMSLFRPRHPDDTLGTLTTRLLFELFGRHGLLVIEPRDLPPEAFPPLERWWSQAETIRERVRQAADELSDVGVDVTIDPAATMMFQTAGSQRVPLADGEAAGSALDLSPGALLRPLWQDACFPSIAFVVGPGELGYLAVVTQLYRLLGVPAPVLVPRASLTLVEPSLMKLLQRFGWDLPDLNAEPETLAANMSDDEGSALEDELDELAARMRAGFEQVLHKLERVDRSMIGAADRARTKAMEEIERLSQKVKNARQNREGTGLRQVRRVCSNLRPRGRPQERVLTALPFLVAHGKELADLVIDAADPFRLEHGVLEL